MELDELDRIATKAFEGYVIRKGLALHFKGRYPVPIYVGEFLLGRYGASSDEGESQKAWASSSCRCTIARSGRAGKSS